MAEVEYAKGLEGVIAGESHICKINGEQGKLYYMGYSIQDLAANTTFEEVVYLLLYGKLPTVQEYKVFEDKMRGSRDLKQPILDMIKNFPRETHPMELLQSVVSYLSGYVEHKIHHSPTCNCRNTLHQVVQMASVIAAYHRFRTGEEYVPPRMDLSHGANFLYMLHGKEPEALEGTIMDKALILHAEHSFNASTFTARVVASTMSTCYSSISAAVGALFGSLHGGANEKVVNMVSEIGSEDRVEEYVHKKLDNHEKIMGMGHRVYKAKDPRAVIMEDFLKQLSEKYDDWTNYNILKKVEKTFRDRMEETGKPIYPNVDFFSGSVYTLLGIPSDLYTPMFAMSRVAGWLSHILEQRSDNKLFRPKALYVGEIDKEFTQMDKR